MNTRQSVTVDILFDAWRKWCRDQNLEHVGSKQDFGKDMNAAFPQVRIRQRRKASGTRERIYKGIGLL